MKEIGSFTRLGFVLVYSTARPASLAVTKFLLSKLRPPIPKMIVAMVTQGSHDSHMIEKGREFAESCGAVFLATDDSDWTSESHDSHMMIML